MVIYILNFSDQDNYCAYTNLQKAKDTLWQCYCDEVDEKERAKYLEEDLKTLEDGYITDYGWIAVTDLLED